MGARLLRDDVRLFQIGAAVIAIAVLDHAFVHPEPGTSAGDHLASGLIPTAITVLAALSYPRLRPGLRACIALIFGSLSLVAGITDGVRHAVINGMSGDDVTAILASVAGAGLVCIGASTLWRSRRRDERLRRSLRAARARGRPRGDRRGTRGRADGDGDPRHARCPFPRPGCGPGQRVPLGEFHYR